MMCNNWPCLLYRIVTKCNAMQCNSLTRCVAVDGQFVLRDQLRWNRPFVNNNNTTKHDHKELLIVTNSTCLGMVMIHMIFPIKFARKSYLCHFYFGDTDNTRDSNRVPSERDKNPRHTNMGYPMMIKPSLGVNDHPYRHRVFRSWEPLGMFPEECFGFTRTPFPQRHFLLQWVTGIIK